MWLLNGQTSAGERVAVLGVPAARLIGVAKDSMVITLERIFRGGQGLETARFLAIVKAESEPELRTLMATALQITAVVSLQPGVVDDIADDGPN